MPVIKRYANRKLYDTEAKQYVTLERIAEQVRDGVEVRVVDHTTGEDLTAVTLAQVILEREKKGGGVLPSAALTRLVQAGGDTLHTLRRALGTPADFARQVDEEILRRLQALVEEGRLTAQEARRLGDILAGAGRPAMVGPWPSEREFRRQLAERGVPTRADLDQLSRQLERLAASLQDVEKDVDSRR